MIVYLTGIILILTAYYIGQYKGYVKAKNNLSLHHKEDNKEIKLCVKNYVIGFGNCLDCELVNKCEHRKDY